MPALDPIPERTNRDFSILHSARFKSNEKTPFWAQSWTPKSVPCNTEYLEVNGGRPQFYNNQQIYKKVIEWFESWRPWQQRTLLCGLTNRCTTGQLKSLATTLEPVFHRDFVNSLKDRYPSASLRKIKKRMRAKRSRGKGYKGRYQRKQQKSRLSSSSGLLSRPLSRSTINEENEGFSRETTMEFEGEDEPEDMVRKQDNPNEIETVEQYADVFVNNVFGDVFKSLDLGNGTESKENAVNRADIILKDSKQKVHNIKGKLQDNPSIAKLEKFLGDLCVVPDQILNTGVLLKYHHNTVRGHRLDSRARFSDSRVLETTSSEGTRSGLAHERHCSVVTTPEMKHRTFFESDKQAKLGPVQAQLRSGNVRRPPNVQDLYVPVQNMYKHVKFWSVNPSTDDKVYVKPKKSQLKRQFTQQLNQIWDWMSGWKDYEALSLLVEVVKLCSSDQTNFLAQCLFDRLRERIDINWLPDRLLLLILSYLPVSEIQNCAQVCKKWKYLTTVDELWMVKCHEYGLEQGIMDITDIVVNASKDGNSIDWKQAFLELQYITEDVKSTLPLPLQLDFETATPEGMQKVGGKLIPDNNEKDDWQLNGNATNTPILRSAGRNRDSTEFSQRHHHGSVSASRTSKRNVTEYDKEIKKKEMENLVSKAHLDRKTEVISKAVKEESSAIVEKRIEEQVKIKVPNTDALDTDKSAPHEYGRQNFEENFRPRNKKKTADEEGEVAVDVRHSLRQSHDLKMGRITEKYNWTKHQIETSQSNLDSIAGFADNIARVRKLQGHMDSVLCVETDGRKLLSGSMDRAIRIWDIRNGRSMHKLLGHKGGVTHIQFAGETLFTGSWDTSIMVWELIYYQRRSVLTGHSGSISGLKLCPEKGLLLSSSHDGTVRVWCTLSHMILYVLQIHAKRQILSMDFDGENIVTSGSDRTIRVTLLQTKECIRTIRNHPGSPEHLQISADLCITTNITGQVFFWDLKKGQLEAGIQGHDSPIKALSYYNGRFYTASVDATIKEWDLVTLSCIRTLQGHKGPVNDVSVNSKFIVTCSTDGHIRVWDREMPKTGGEEDSIRLQVIDYRNVQQQPVPPKSADSERPRSARK